MDNTEKGTYSLVAFRILLGWMFIWGFLDKMFGLGFETPSGSGVIDGGSPSSFVTYVSGGVFEGLFDSLAGNTIVDFLLMAGLLILGVTLIVGIASKLTTIFSIVFTVVMFCLCVPPTDNPLIDYHIMLAVGIAIVYFFNGFEYISLNEKWKSTKIVEMFPILE